MSPSPSTVEVVPGGRHPRRRRSGPTLRVERRHWSAGSAVVVGIDEVGRGSWAGPVTVAAVVAPDEHLAGVRDSKEMSPEARAAMAPRIEAWARAVAVGHASHAECDDLGMTAALRRAAGRALDALAARGWVADRVLLDGTHDYLGLGDRVETIVRADATVLSVAAASVVAKVARDGMMAAAAEHYPPYAFEANRGYPAPAHRCALAAYGPSAIHRRSWVFMDALPWCGLHRPGALQLFPA